MVALFEAVKVSTEILCLESAIRRHVYILVVRCIPVADSWKSAHFSIASPSAREVATEDPGWVI